METIDNVSSHDTKPNSQYNISIALDSTNYFTEFYIYMYKYKNKL